jgi:hypothetical protein
MIVSDLLARVVRAFMTLVCLCFLTSPLAAQTPAHGTHQQPADHQQHQPAATDIPASRDASGTAWLPDASPMYAIHGEYRAWKLMGHGTAFVQYLNDGGDRGQDQFGSINWMMGMAERSFGDERLRLRGMISFEPATIGGCGYPDLLASGEVCDGAPIVDRQHPHDLLMEIAAQYDRTLTSGMSVQVYGGLAGEPALGPVAFPHRISAMPNPIAPLSHHWLDATHISYGVITGGLYGKLWKAEGSIFNGREPDDERIGLEFGALDSFSGRAWYLPNENMAFQFSAGHLEEAEADPNADVEDPARVDVDRITVSATYHQPFREGSSTWASTIAWGRNAEEGEEATSFLLAETNVTFDDQDAWYGRFEIGHKTGHDLALDDDEARYTVSKLQAGYTRYFEEWNGFQPGVGATLSLSLVPSALDTVYGDRSSFGFGIYVTLRPRAMQMSRAMQGH